MFKICLRKNSDFSKGKDKNTPINKNKIMHLKLRCGQCLLYRCLQLFFHFYLLVCVIVVIMYFQFLAAGPHLLVLKLIPDYVQRIHFWECLVDHMRFQIFNLGQTHISQIPTHYTINLVSLVILLIVVPEKLLMISNIIIILGKLAQFLLCQSHFSCIKIGQFVYEKHFELYDESLKT